MQNHQPSGSGSSNTVRPRRGHIKSRHGCLECKRRHYKCDETHPVCVRCRQGSRECIYPQQDRLETGQLEVSQSASSTSAIPPQQLLEPPEPVSESTGKDGSIALNMLHLELLHNFTAETFVPAMGDGLLGATRLVIEAGFHAPYLMYETLALSARHLACLRLPERDMYLQQAMKLQTHAIFLFNKDESKFDEKSSVARLLFSSLMSRHLLADALSHRDGELDSFLDGFLRYNRLHRSIMALSGDAWPFLRQSALKDVMVWGRAIFDVQPRGHHCDDIHHLLSVSEMNEDSRGACKEAVHFLQVGFDESEGGYEQGHTIHVIFWWAILMPEEFVQLLANKQPEAIVILAYYAALLQQGKSVWLIGDAARHLIHSISQGLGPEWSDWLLKPRSLLQSI